MKTKQNDNLKKKKLGPSLQYLITQFCRYKSSMRMRYESQFGVFENKQCVSLIIVVKKYLIISYLFQFVGDRIKAGLTLIFAIFSPCRALR